MHFYTSFLFIYSDFCLKYISYDPNYNYDDDENINDENSMEQDENVMDEK
jgi:hypothetical protein